MKIIQGDCGALLFRVDRSTTNFYLFEVCQDGTFSLFLYGQNLGSNAGVIINHHSASAVNVGVNRSNLVAIVAQGSTLELYVNHSQVVSISDRTYSHGKIGVVADGFPGNHPTEVVYSNAKVWTL